jgi:hypothetical protein
MRGSVRNYMQVVRITDDDGKTREAILCSWLEFSKDGVECSCPPELNPLADPKVAYRWLKDRGIDTQTGYRSLLDIYADEDDE